MDSKTNIGVAVTAHQRVNADEEITVRGTTIGTGSMGELVISCSAGDEHGMKFKATVSLDEVLAWLPEMTEKARSHAAAKTTQQLTEDLRQEGILIATYPQLKVLNPIPKR